MLRHSLTSRNFPPLHAVPSSYACHVSTRKRTRGHEYSIRVMALMKGGADSAPGSGSNGLSLQSTSDSRVGTLEAGGTTGALPTRTSPEDLVIAMDAVTHQNMPRGTVINLRQGRGRDKKRSDAGSRAEGNPSPPSSNPAAAASSSSSLRHPPASSSASLTSLASVDSGGGPIIVVTRPLPSVLILHTGGTLGMDVVSETANLMTMS